MEFLFFVCFDNNIDIELAYQSRGFRYTPASIYHIYIEQEKQTHLFPFSGFELLRLK